MWMKVRACGFGDKFAFNWIFVTKHSFAVRLNNMCGICDRARFYVEHYHFTSLLHISGKFGHLYIATEYCLSKWNTRLQLVCDVSVSNSIVLSVREEHRVRTILNTSLHRACAINTGIGNTHLLVMFVIFDKFTDTNWFWFMAKSAAAVWKPLNSKNSPKAEIAMW